MIINFLIFFYLNKKDLIINKNYKININFLKSNSFKRLIPLNLLPKFFQCKYEGNFNTKGGENLLGNIGNNSIISFNFLNFQNCSIFCKIDLDQEKIFFIDFLIHNNYKYNFKIGDLILKNEYGEDRKSVV